MQEVNNFRPISMSTILSKLIEKLMICRTVRFIEKNNMLTPKQYGFRANYGIYGPLRNCTE